jgi:hypothetical protein
LRVATNEKLIRNWTRISQAFGMGGLGILVLGLVLSFRPEYFLASYAVLIVGILTSSVGIYYGDKWIKPPRADQTLEDALKGLDNKHRLYNWVLPVDHVLLSPTGLTVFIVKKQEGRIEYDGQRWRHRQSLFKLLGAFSRERLGNPAKELEWDVDRLHQLVEQVLPGTEVPIDGYIVFTSPKADLELANGSVPAVPVKKLKAQFKSQSRRRKLSEETRRQLEDALDEIAAPRLSAKG